MRLGLRARSALLRRPPTAVLRPTAAALCHRTVFGAALRGLSTMPPPGAPPPPPPPPPGAAAGGKNTQQIVEITSGQEFDQLCVAASATPPPVGGPVILDFYADWCQPCKTLTPKLTSLVERAAGAVRLAKINVDNLPELAQALQVASLPTVMLLHKGKLVDSFQGVLPDGKIKEFVDKAVGLAGGAGPNSEQALAAAAKFLEEGDVPAATQAYADLMQLPELGGSARAGLALCALKDDNLALAQDLVAQIHKEHADDLNKPDVRKAISTINLAVDAPAGEGSGRSPSELRAALETDPKDHAARFELAQSLLQGGDQAGAIDELLLIVRRDKKWEEGKPRDLLLKLFESLGPESDVAKKGRRKLSNYMLI